LRQNQAQSSIQSQSLIQTLKNWEIFQIQQLSPKIRSNETLKKHNTKKSEHKYQKNAEEKKPNPNYEKGAKLNGRKRMKRALR